MSVTGCVVVQRQGGGSGCVWTWKYVLQLVVSGGCRAVCGLRNVSCWLRILVSQASYGNVSCWLRILVSRASYGNVSCIGMDSGLLVKSWEWERFRCMDSGLPVELWERFRWMDSGLPIELWEYVLLVKYLGLPDREESRGT